MCFFIAFRLTSVGFTVFRVTSTGGGAWNTREVACKDTLIASLDAREVLWLGTAYLPLPTGLTSPFPAVVCGVSFSCVCAFVSVRVKVCVCSVVDVGAAVLDSVCSAASLVLQEVTMIGCSSKSVKMRSPVSAQESGNFCEPAERTRQQVTRQRHKEEQREHASRMRAVGRPTHQSGAPLRRIGT